MSDQANDLLAAESQVRAATVVDVDTDRGVIDAKIVPYEQRAQIDHDLWEVFTRGAFASAVSSPHRVKVSNQQHDMKVTIGSALLPTVTIGPRSGRTLPARRGTASCRSSRIIRPLRIALSSSGDPRTAST